MNKEKIKIAREALSDLSYYEWIELRERVDIEFKRIKIPRHSRGFFICGQSPMILATPKGVGTV